MSRPRGPAPAAPHRHVRGVGIVFSVDVPPPAPDVVPVPSPPQPPIPAPPEVDPGTPPEIIEPPLPGEHVPVRDPGAPVVPVEVPPMSLWKQARRAARGTTTRGLGALRGTRLLS